MTNEPTHTTSKRMMLDMPSLQLSIVTGKEKCHCTSFSAMFCPLYKVTNREHCEKVFYNLSSHNLCKHREAICITTMKDELAPCSISKESEIPGKFITFGLVIPHQYCQDAMKVGFGVTWPEKPKPS